MEVCMSKTRRGKYTDNRICYISKCKGDMRLYLRRKGKLPCFSYLVRGKSFSFYRGKVQIKFEKLTPFGGIFSIMEKFDSMLSPIIDQTLGQRCRSIIGCLVIQRQKRMDGVLDLLEGEYTYRCIRLQLHLRTCQVDHDSKAIRAEYLY